MKTRPPETPSQPSLPPPPAPTARDANPWPLSTPVGSDRHPRRAARAPAGPPRTGTDAGAQARRTRRRRWVPPLTLLFMAGVGLQLASEALRSGAAEHAVAAVAILAMVCFIGVRRFMKGKR